MIFNDVNKFIVRFFILLSLVIILISCSVDQDLDVNNSKNYSNSNKNEMITFIDVEEIGDIAVKIIFPEEPKYDYGAPVVVGVSTFLTGEKGFIHEIGVEEEGFVYITYLWPGMEDNIAGVSSDGEYDYGGEDCQLALKEVILFALGEKEDVKGNIINDHYDTLNDNVGLYAFSHPGVISINTLSIYSEELSNVAWFVGRENPTNDEIFAVELGYVKTEATPYYSYPEDYDPYDLEIDFSLANYDYNLSVVFFDENDNNILNEDEFRLTTFGPTAYDERYYSVDLTTVLDQKLDIWPEGVATLEEVGPFWPIRTTVSENHDYYLGLNSDLNVILIFAGSEHVQPFDDKPSIHQAYDGFTRSGNWIRLNPDSAYLSFSTDNYANSQPGNWSDAVNWAYQDLPSGTKLAPIAALNEITDRTYYDNWEDNLDDVLS